MLGELVIEKHLFDYFEYVKGKANDCFEIMPYNEKNMKWEKAITEELDTILTFIDLYEEDKGKYYDIIERLDKLNGHIMVKLYGFIQEAKDGNY